MNRKPNRDRLSPSDVEILGVVGTFTYGRYNGVEYLIEPLAAMDSARPMLDDELRTVETKQRVDFGTTTSFQEWQRGSAVPAGSYERMAAKATGRFRGPKPPRPIDLVSRLLALRGTPDRIFPVADRKFSDLNLEAERATLPGAPIAGFLPGTPAASDDPAAIVARLERRGVALSVTPGGRLLAVTSGGHIPDDLLSVLVGCERLLVAELMETPLLCEAGPHAGPVPKAVTTLAVNVPSCRDHAAGRLPLTTEAA